MQIDFVLEQNESPLLHRFLPSLLRAKDPAAAADRDPRRRLKCLSVARGQNA